MIEILVIVGLAVAFGMSARKPVEARPVVDKLDVQAPVDLKALVQRVAREWLVDEVFAAAIVEKESAWNALARSPVTATDERRGGAWGLFQVTYETAREEEARFQGYGRSSLWRLLSPTLAAESLYEPNVNAEIGCAHLSYLGGKVSGLHEIAAAYNGGVAGRSGAQAQRYADDVMRRYERLTRRVS